MPKRYGPTVRVLQSHGQYFEIGPALLVGSISRIMPVSIITFACGGLEKIWKAQEASKIYISNFVCEENALPIYVPTYILHYGISKSCKGYRYS